MSEPSPSSTNPDGFRVLCPHCGQPFSCADRELPEQLQCPRCRGSFLPGSSPTVSHPEATRTRPADVPAQPPAPLPELADFEILEVIGQGGMGIVYRARDRRLPRQVALKMILAGKAADPDQWARLSARFRREAEAVARLAHPNIVQIFTIAESPLGPYFVMELVTGGSLAARIKGSPQDPRVSAGLVQTLALAMQAAHQEHVVHRDLKPANVLLQTDHADSAAGGDLRSAVPKIADFGLAKQLDENQTVTEGVAGTPSYMAPEQARRGAKEVGPAADIYALGAILYELLTGQPPFRGASLLDTLDQVRNQEPVPPTRWQPRIPFDLEVICLKCLQKEPRKRYGSAGQLAADLGRFLEGKPILARPVGRLEKAWKWTRRYPARAALVVLSVLAVLGVLAAVVRDDLLSQQYAENLKQENEQTELARKEAVKNAALAKTREGEAEERRREAERERRLAVEKTIRLTVAGGQQHQRDGDLLTAMLAYAEAAALEEPGSPQAVKHQIRLGTCLEQAPRPVQLWAHKDAVTHVEFSPDGKSVLTASQDGTARVWDAVTGEPRFDQPLAHKGPINHAAFSPDGLRVLTGSADKTARLWDAVTGRPLAPELVHPYPVLQVGFGPLPRGPLLTVTGTRNAVGFTDNSPPTYREQRIMTGTGPNGVPQFTTIMVPAGPGGPVRRDPHGLALLWDDPAGGKPGQKFSHVGWINHAAFRPDGLAVATANCSLDRSNGVRVWPLDGKPPADGLTLKEAFQVLYVAFSPDGRRLVTACGKADSNRGEARLWDLASGEQVGAAMRHQGMVTEAHFSPDGRLVLTAGLDGTARLWDADSGAATAEPLRHRGRVNLARFSPDGRRVVTASDDGTARLWDAQTGTPLGAALGHGNPVTSVAFHPDAPLLVTGCRDGTVRLWDLAGAALGRPVLKAHKVLPPVQVVGFTAHAGGRTVRNVQTLPGRIATSAAFSPDGKFVLAGGGARFVDLLPGGGLAQTLSGFKTTHLCVWDSATGRLQSPPVQHTLPITPSWIGPNGQVAVLASDAEDPFPGRGKFSIDVLEIAGGKRLHHFPVPAGEEVKDLCFPPGGDACLLALKPEAKDKNAELRVYRVRDGKPAVSPLPVRGLFEHACLSGDGQCLAVLTLRAGADKTTTWTAQVWSLQDPPRLLGPEVHRAQPVNQVVLSRDGRRAVLYQAGMALGFQATGPALPAQESEAWLWQVDNGAGAALGHKGPIQYAGFDPGGGRVLTCSQDRTARVWDAASGKPLTPPLEHGAAVYHADVSKDGLVVTAAGDHASLWDLETGEMIGPPMRHHDWVIHASFSPDGRRLATAGCDGVVRLWDLGVSARSPREWQTLAQLLSGHRIDATRGMSPLPRADLLALWKDLRGREADVFTSSPRRTLAWHEEELELALRAGDAPATLAHLAPLTAAAPERIDFWLLRGKGLAQVRRLPEALECFAAAYKLDPLSLDACYPLTLVAQALGKKDEARTNAEHLLKHFGDKSLTALRGSAVAVRDALPELLPLAERMAGQKAPPPGAQSVLGAARFRAGKVDAAIETFTAAHKNSRGGEAAWNALFLALAYRQKGDAAEAGNWLQKADDALKPPAAPGRRPAPLPWELGLELDLLRQEAR
jgi:WD40 repeat protein